MKMFIASLFTSIMISVTIASGETYDIFLTPSMPAGLVVAPLNALTKARSVPSPKNHKVLEISKTDLFSPSTVIENDSSKIQAALDCSKRTKGLNGFLQYFCMDQPTYTIKTASGYNPPEGSGLVISFKIETHWSDRASEVNTLRIHILAACQAQRGAYNALRTCQPPLIRVNPQLVGGTFRYNLTNRQSRFTLHTIQISEEIFKNPSHEASTLAIQIIYGGTEKLKIINVTETLRPANVSVFLALPFGTEDFSLSVLDHRRRAILLTSAKDVTVFLYDAQTFCARQDCLLKLDSWMLLVNEVRDEEKSCVSDPLQVRKTLSTCYEGMHVRVEALPAVKGGFSEGNSMSLLCNHSEILLPFSIRWFHIRGGVMTPIESPSPQLAIPSISRAEWGAFVCRVSSLDSVYTSTSNRFYVSFKDLIWIRLELLVGQLKYTATYGEPFSEASQQLMTSLRNSAFRSILLSRLFQNRAADLTASHFRNDSASGLTWLLLDFYVKRLGSIDNEALVYTSAKQAVLNGSRGTYGTLFGGYNINKIAMSSENACSDDTSHVGKWETYQLDWSATTAGETVSIPCPENPLGKAYRTCKPPSLAGDFAAWTSVDASECTFEGELRYVLEQLSRRSSKASSSILTAEKLERISTRPDDITSADELAIISTLLEDLTARLSDDVYLQGRVFRTVDNLLAVNRTLFYESQTTFGTSTRFLNLLGNASEALLATTNEVSVSMKNFALAGMAVPTEAIKDISIDLHRWTNSSMEIDFRVQGSSNLLGTSAQATIVIPGTIGEALPNDTVKAMFVSFGFHDDLLFQGGKSSNHPSDEWMTDTHILSAEIRGVQIQNLKSPIKLMFARKSSEFSQSNRKCVFWDFDSQDWSSRGCTTKEHSGASNITICECNHLTNFAVLFSAVPPAGIHGRILTIVTYVGLAVSLLGASLTFLTHAIFPMLRKTIPPKILMNLCAALIILMVLFLIAVEQAEGTLPCKLLAILLQYFLLAVFFWSAVEGFHSVRGLVFPMRAEMQMFMQKACLVGWGLPAIWTLIGAAVWHPEYGKKAGCVARNLPFYVTILQPISAILIGNFVALGLIMKSLKGNATKGLPQTISFRDRLRIITGFVILFGLTWIFGFFVIDQTCIACQYVFCAIASLQGLYLVVFYGLRNEKFRSSWLDLLHGLKPKDIQRRATKRLQQARKDDRASRGTFLSDST